MSEEHSFWDPFPELQAKEKMRPSFRSESTWQEWEYRNDEKSVAILIWLSHYMGWGVSLVLHAFVALALGYVIFQPALGGNIFSLETRIESGDLGLDSGGSGSFTDTKLGGSPLELAGLTKGVEAGDTGEATAASPLEPHPVNLKGASTTLVAGSVASLGGTGLGIGRMDGSGEGGHVEFFGSRGLGNSVVFVVDMSGSMQNDKRFIVAQRELIQSINKLQKQQRFYVIFYNMKELPIFAPRSPMRMIAATPDLKNQARTWINTVRPGGGTDPIPALEQAIKLRPDMIYFLTDGEIPAGTREMLTQANRNRITIHTIAFQSKEGQEILKQIADDHRGTFRFVP